MEQVEKKFAYELRRLKRQICCILENGGSSGGNQNLQQVTDVGNTTNNSLLVIPTNVDKEISIVNTQTVANIFGNMPQGGVKLILSDKVVGDDEFIGTIELINNLGYSAILSPQLIDGDIIMLLLPNTPPDRTVIVTGVNGVAADDTGNVIVPLGAPPKKYFSSDFTDAVTLRDPWLNGKKVVIFWNDASRYLQETEYALVGDTLTISATGFDGLNLHDKIVVTETLN